ncbi:MAG: hypothetical protein JEZ03_04550, partial [Bacteroidales bacterium]|nr:hypothetical protein [Bacteroidales bacterium]
MNKSDGVMAHEISWEVEGVYCKFYDTVDLQDIMQFNDKLYGDSRFSKIKYQIVDHAQMKNLVLSDNDMKIIGTLDRVSGTWNSKMKIAVITDNLQLIELSQIYKSVVENVGW